MKNIFTGKPLIISETRSTTYVARNQKRTTLHEANEGLEKEEH